MSKLIQELRLGVRMWARRPALAAAIIATLSIGIGANVAVYTVVDGVLLQPFPYRERVSWRDACSSGRMISTIHESS